MAAEDRATRHEFSRTTTAGLAIALFGLPLLSGATRALRIDLHPLVTIAAQWALLGLVVGITIEIEGRSLRSLGVRQPSRRDAVPLLVAAVLGFFALAATGPLIDALGLPERRVTGLDVDRVGVGVAVAFAVTVGVVEEVLYRGYAIERLAERTGSARLAGVISWAAFTLSHAVGWRLGDLLQVSLAALVFTLAYLYRRSLVPVVGAHIAIWLFGVLGAVYG
ncbi:Abortive infection protein [Haloterrigena turkmenica DSM 5511]|uniref:Abortive infection protein n=1 Tax=Haloterrigena turkmenica (strain ATCC 51198 / DSM 5511 / JCM 9101 / NCIMB 13204 / VKM B-1734 / 4k) TaxID=543526 RepID=D2RTN3_HALTV|nr:type II CAAX endopeptidase family protein [Haloterrigena turkmenica]ADB59076.1 Abortive infection protein [Haloterrigena turkmenica DSM 5511]